MADESIQFDIKEWWVVFVAFGIPVVYFIYVMIVCYCDVLKQKKAAIAAHRKHKQGIANPVMIRPHPSGSYLLDEQDASPTLPNRKPGVHKPNNSKQSMVHSASANQVSRHQQRRSSNDRSSQQQQQARRARNLHV